MIDKLKVVQLQMSYQDIQALCAAALACNLPPNSKEFHDRSAAIGAVAFQMRMQGIYGWEDAVIHTEAIRDIISEGAIKK